MKKEILLIVTLILVEICTMYSNVLYNLVNSHIIIIALGIVFLVGNIILCIKDRDSNNKKVIFFIMAIFLILTILKIFYMISINNEQNKLKQMMQKIDESFSQCNSFDELYQVANITEEKVNKYATYKVDTSNNIYVFYKNYMNNMVLSPIYNAKSYYNNSYSKFKNSRRSISVIYGQELNTVYNEQFSGLIKSGNIIIISSIIYEIVLIAVFYVIGNKKLIN